MPNKRLAIVLTKDDIVYCHICASLGFPAKLEYGNMDITFVIRYMTRVGTGRHASPICICRGA